MRTLVLMAALSFLAACNQTQSGATSGPRRAPLVLSGPEAPPPQAPVTYIRTPSGNMMVCRQVFDIVTCN